SAGGGAGCATWFRYASPPINTPTITSATSTSSTVTSVVTLGAPISLQPRAQRWDGFGRAGRCPEFKRPARPRRENLPADNRPVYPACHAVKPQNYVRGTTCPW